MKSFFGITDNDWFAFLSQQPGIDEVNFWQERLILRPRLLKNEQINL